MPVQTCENDCRTTQMHIKGIGENGTGRHVKPLNFSKYAACSSPQLINGHGFVLLSRESTGPSALIGLGDIGWSRRHGLLAINIAVEGYQAFTCLQVWKAAHAGPDIARRDDAGLRGAGALRMRR